MHFNKVNKIYNINQNKSNHKNHYNRKESITDGFQELLNVEIGELHTTLKGRCFFKVLLCETKPSFHMGQ